MASAAALLVAQESKPELLDPQGGVEFIEMPARTILNRCDNPLMPFRWTINPYRGCEFGCVYCYARYTHDFLELRDPLDFERRIFVKRMAAAVLARTLSRTPIGADAIAMAPRPTPINRPNAVSGSRDRCWKYSAAWAASISRSPPSLI